LTKNAGRYGSHPVYLAVETSKIFESEIMHNLYAKLINSETTATFFARSAGRHRDAVDLKGIMIFGEGRRPAATHRYIAVETLRPTKEWLEANLNKRAAARMAQPSARMAELERLHWLMVFDTQTQQFVGSGVYAVESLPAVEPLMTFDTMSAEFVGQGSL